MPIYEYVCQDCEQKFEKFIRSRMAKVILECPSCGSDRANKAFSAFSTRNSGGISQTIPASSAPACGPIG